MSAQQALQERVAELLRRHPPVPAPQQAAMALRHAVTVDGELLQDARVCTDRTTRAALLTVRIKQAHTTTPLVAVQRYDSTAASFAAAHSKASRLRAGTAVHVTGEGLRLTQHRGEQVIEIAQAHSIEPPQHANTRKDLE